MEEWYEELDFEENPFSTNPSDFVKNIVGRDEIIDDLIYRVRAGSLVFLEGEEGSGKSALLRVLIRKFRGKGRVIYVNCEKLEADLNIEDLLVQRNGFIKGMIMKKTPKNMILLLDNVPKLSHKNMERIKYYFDENFLKTVVFTGESFKDVGFSKSLIQRIEGRVITIPPLESYQAVDLVRERIGDIKFISDELIEQIAEATNYNPKRLLKALEEISEYVVSIDEDTVDAKHVEQVLGKKLSKKDDSSLKPGDTDETNSASIEESVEEEIETKDDAKKTVEEETEDVPSEEKGSNFASTKTSEKSNDESKVSEPKKKDDASKKKDSKEQMSEDAETSDDSESVEEVSEDVIKKPIIAEETEESKAKESADDDDDFFADDFFDEDEDTKKSSSDETDKDEDKKKKSEEDSFEEYDDFFDDDFDK